MIVYRDRLLTPFLYLNPQLDVLNTGDVTTSLGCYTLPRRPQCADCRSPS